MRFTEALVLFLACGAMGIAIAVMIGADINLVRMFEDVAGWFDFIEGWGD